MTELLGVVITLEERSGTWLRKKPTSLLGEVCNGGKEIPVFQRHDVDPSSEFRAPPTTGGISMLIWSELEPGWAQVISDSEAPVERLNCKSTFGCHPAAFIFELANFFELDTFSLPRWRVKSNSRAIDDSSSVSLADDIVVQAVAELPLLSEELDERPSPRDNVEPTLFEIGRAHV